MNKRQLRLRSALITLSGAAVAGEPFGVNLACGDFGSVFPGEYNKHYTYPTDADLIYWQQKGLMLVRLPFRWERLQNKPDGPLNQNDLAKVKDFV